MEERRVHSQIDLGQIKIVFWILCLAFGGYVTAWGVNENWKNQRFDNLQLGEDRVWAKIGAVETKLDSVQAKEIADYEYLLQHFYK